MRASSVADLPFDSLFVTLSTAARQVDFFKMEQRAGIGLEDAVAAGNRLIVGFSRYKAKALASDPINQIGWVDLRNTSPHSVVSISSLLASSLASFLLSGLIRFSLASFPASTRTPLPDRSQPRNGSFFALRTSFLTPAHRSRHHSLRFRRNRSWSHFLEDHRG